MTIIDEVIDTLSQLENSIFTAKQIKDFTNKKHGSNKSSVIPSDYCYNRTNKGAEFKRQILIRLSPNEYKFVGENYQYNGWIYQKEKGSEEEEIVGQWENGEPVFFSPKPINPPRKTEQNTDNTVEINLDFKQIEKLYEEYLSLLELEVKVFGCKPTETRHLIGRIGEFKCAILTKGHLARTTNQHGFDIISKSGSKISVKTTAQKKGFVAINKKTVHLADELMVIQYKNNDFVIIYYGSIKKAIKEARLFENKYELDISKAKRLSKILATN